MSPPAHSPRSPAPASTTPPTRSSAAQAASCSSMRRNIGWVSALIVRGRLRLIQPRPRSTRNRTSASSALIRGDPTGRPDPDHSRPAGLDAREVAAPTSDPPISMRRTAGRLVEPGWQGGVATPAPPGWLVDQRVQAVPDVEQAGDEQEQKADDHHGDADGEDHPPEDGDDDRGDDDQDEDGILAARGGRGEGQHLRSLWAKDARCSW